MTDFAQHWVNLASAKLGATAIACSDDFFAPMHRMLQDTAPVFIADKYDQNGKWMDGWESRRKRTPGHDWCIVKLAKPGVIHGVELDTRFFTGNYAPAASIEACICAHARPPANQKWVEIIEKADLDGDSLCSATVDAKAVYSHIKLHIYPDGGIARVRVYAEPKVDWDKIGDNELIDLGAALNGGVALVCNNEHFGSMKNLLAPGRGVNMGDGWETRRRREPGNDWVIIALAHSGIIKQVEIDTAHFKGNYPDRCDIRGAMLRATSIESLPTQSEDWHYLLEQSKLAADHIHQFAQTIKDLGPVSHIRLNIHPDGGISRIRLLGVVDR